MQNKESEKSKDLSPAKNIIVDFDNQTVDFDDISFKPITEGLGFNSKEKENVINFKKQTKINNTKTKFNHEKFAEKIGVPQYLKQKQASANNTLSNLSIFNKEATKNKSVDVLNKKVTPILSSKYKNFFAWTLDVLIIIFCISVTLSGFLLSPGIEVKMLLPLIEIEEIVTFLIGMFSVCYLFYFSILDYFTSPGKYLLKIKLIKNHDDHVTVLDCMIRSTASLLSFLAIGLPFLMDFQGKLSDTKIVKR